MEVKILKLLMKIDLICALTEKNILFWEITNENKL